MSNFLEIWSEILYPFPYKYSFRVLWFDYLEVKFDKKKKKQKKNDLIVSEFVPFLT